MAPKAELMRIALVRGGAGDAPGLRAVHDERATLPGRGAYLCIDADRRAPRAACLAHALRRGAIARALRANAPVDLKLVESIAR